MKVVKLFSIIIPCLFASTFNCGAQESNPDSAAIRATILDKQAIILVNKDIRQAISKEYFAIKNVERSNSKEIKGDVYNNLGIMLKMAGKYDSALIFLRKSLNIRKRINDLEQIGKTYNNLGIIYKIKGHFDSSLYYYFQSLNFKRRNKDSAGIAASFNNIGLLYNEQGKYDSALQNFVKSYNLKKALGDEKSLIYPLNNIGLVYLDLEEFKKALQQFQQVIKIQQKYDLNAGIPITYNNMGLAYQGINEKDSAFKYFRKSLKIRKAESNDAKVAISMEFMGKSYLENEIYDSALFLLQKSIKIKEQLNLEGEIGSAYFLAARAALKTGNSDLASTYINKAENTAEQTNSNQLLADVLNLKALILHNQGKNAEAYQIFRKAYELREQLFNKERAEALSEMQAQYEAEQQKQEIKSLAKEKESIRNRNVKNEIALLIAMALLVTIVVITFLLYRQTQLRKKANKLLKEKNKIIQDNYEKLKVSKIKAEAAAFAKSQFLAIASHEIRTPLNGIIGMTSLLLNTNLNEEQFDYTRTIMNSGNNLFNLLNEILDYSKAEAGKIELEKKPTDIKKIGKEVIHLFEHQAKEKNIELILNVEELTHNIWIVDALRLRQVLVNLISNALKFTGKGFVKLSISHASSKEDQKYNTILFSVIDTGPGIPREKQKIIFDSFSQADASITRKYGGVGLGLAISQKLVELMNGELKIKSKIGKGTTFYFSLELEATENTETATVAEDYSIDENLSNEFPLDILVAEDNIINQKLILKIFEKFGYQVELAFDGNEVLDKLSGKNYDLILMDIQMPQLNGIEATKIIRETYLNVKQPIIIALTANTTPEAVKEYYAVGMDDIIGKPFQVGDLKKLIIKWSTKRKTQDL